jgi:hypothetical protein
MITASGWLDHLLSLRAALEDYTSYNQHCLMCDGLVTHVGTKAVLCGKDVCTITYVSLIPVNATSETNL